MQVGPGVLIPRPETENIIDFCEDALLSHPELGTGCWVDLGTGSGVPRTSLGAASTDHALICHVMPQPHWPRLGPAVLTTEQLAWP